MSEELFAAGEEGEEAWPHVPKRSFNRIFRVVESLGMDFSLGQRAVTLDTGKNHTCLTVRLRSGGKFKTVEFIYRDGRFHHAMAFDGSMHALRPGPPEDVERIRTLGAALNVVHEGVG